MTDQTAAAAGPPTVFPVLRYADAPKALEWLEQAFGFHTVVAVPGKDGAIAHAQMSFGLGVIMFASAADTVDPDAAPDPSTARRSIYVYVHDVDAHAARARSGGAEITQEPAATDYGSREYAARDFEGNHWSFGTYLPRPDQA